MKKVKSIFNFETLKKKNIHKPLIMFSFNNASLVPQEEVCSIVLDDENHRSQINSNKDMFNSAGNLEIKDSSFVSQFQLMIYEKLRNLE